MFTANVAIILGPGVLFVAVGCDLERAARAADQFILGVGRLGVAFESTSLYEVAYGKLVPLSSVSLPRKIRQVTWVSRKPEEKASCRIRVHTVDRPYRGESASER